MVFFDIINKPYGLSFTLDTIIRKIKMYLIA